MTDILSGLPAWMKLTSGATLLILIILIAWGGGEWRLWRTPRRGILMVLRWNGLRRKAARHAPRPPAE